MQLANDSARYGVVSQWLHWATAALVIVLLVTGKVGDIEADKPGNVMFFWHSSLGVLVLLLAAARIIWGLFSATPSLSHRTSRINQRLARSMHIWLYVLLLALPVSGWLTSSAEGASISFFGIVDLPKLDIKSATRAALLGNPEPKMEAAGGGNESGWKEIHEVLGNVLLFLASVHILAALKHHFIDRDEVLKRMLPVWRKTPSSS